MSAATTADVVSLPALAERVREAHAEVESHGRATVAAAIRAGEALIEAKAAVVHGEWLPWLESVGVPRRTASAYSRLAANGQRVAHLPTVREALAELTEARDEPEPETPVHPGQTDLVQQTHHEPALPAADVPVEVVDAEPVPEASTVPDADPVPAPQFRNQRHEQRAKATAKRFEQFVIWASVADDIATGKAPFDIALASDAMTSDERHEAARQLSRGAAAFRSLAKQLTEQENA